MKYKVQDAIVQAYAAFNQRNIDAALALMSDDVSWPKASEGGRVVGKDEIRAYWLRQWAEFDPRVEPVSMDKDDAETVVVRVHQVVRTRAGELLADGEVEHVFTMRDGLIAQMDVREEGEAGQPSRAFSPR